MLSTDGRYPQLALFLLGLWFRGGGLDPHNAVRLGLFD